MKPPAAGEDDRAGRERAVLGLQFGGVLLALALVDIEDNEAGHRAGHAFG